MWHELEGPLEMSERKICPIMSDSGGRILCQGRNCYSAYPWVLMGETLWFCTIIDGPRPAHAGAGPDQIPVPGDHGG